MNSRRQFLQNVSMGLVAAAVVPAFGGTADDSVSQAVPGKEGMILRSHRFLDLEMPMEFLNSWITPVPHFFVRNHMFEPTTLDAAEWRLTIGGEVEKPLTLSLGDLRKLQPHSVANTLECAGNGRGFHNPLVPGVQWQRGAVGTARFSGPRLHDLLARAGVKPAGRHVMFRGLDEAPGKVPQFIRSVPIEKAMDSDTLIAVQMNGSPLTKHHGFPARALVPGWIGAASCKWLTEIKVLDKEFEGNFMKPGYRFPNKPVEPGAAVNPEETHPVTSLAVKSIIASPESDAKVRSRQLSIRGAAWAGEDEIAKVEVSTDSGASWHPAVLRADRAKYAWRLWSYSWKPAKSGEYVILSRATDTQGRVQPEKAAWNPSGYLYNAIDQVKVHVQV